MSALTQVFFGDWAIGQNFLNMSANNRTFLSRMKLFPLICADYRMISAVEGGDVMVEGEEDRRTVALVVDDGDLGSQQQQTIAIPRVKKGERTQQQKTQQKKLC